MTSDEAVPFEGDDHLVDTRRADAEMALDVGLGDRPNRPVERRRTAIAGRTGMDDRHSRLRQTSLGNRLLQERRDHKIRPMQRHALARDLGMDVELDRDIVASIPELDMQPLRQAVEGMRQEQDAHDLPQQILGNCSPDGQSTIRPPPKLVAICTK
ncbi:hypothetical protein [Bradyrhizobium rifense]|uniref:hypothetical protein n=1 Tax=Bradyrhizobium rifense TaxID=515499 RepID=UPI0032215804